MIGLRNLFVVLLAVATNAAQAQTPTRIYKCTGVFAGADSIKVMRTIAPKTDVQTDFRAGCPRGAACTSKTLEVDEEVLIALDIRSDEFVCAYHHKSRHVGWILMSQLKPAPERAGPIALDDWVGHWINDRNEDSRIDIAVDGSLLTANGMSYWPGRLYEQKPGMPSIKTGMFDLKGAPDSGVLNLEDSHVCKISLRLIGDYLVAADNKNCGGLNVSFSDVYVRRETIS